MVSPVAANLTAKESRLIYSIQLPQELLQSINGRRRIRAALGWINKA
jgi:hypothetical protein